MNHCSIEGCDRPYCAKGYCQHHYDKIRNNGDPLFVRKYAGRQQCTIEGCDESRVGNGYCIRHYGRDRRYGDPLAVIKSDLTAIQRFWTKVFDTSDPDACWIWGGGVDRDNYGRDHVMLNGKREQIAHRISYIECYGAIPADDVIDHECHNRDLSCAGGNVCEHRKCVNPAHLVAKFNTENIFASVHPFASKNRIKTHCLNGHPLSGSNLLVQKKNGKRSCRTCKTISKRNTQRKRMGLPLIDPRSVVVDEVMQVKGKKGVPGNFELRRASTEWLDGDCPPSVLATFDLGDSGLSTYPLLDRYVVFFAWSLFDRYGDAWVPYYSTTGTIGKHAMMRSNEVSRVRRAMRNNGRPARWTDLPTRVQTVVREQCDQQAQSAA